MSFSGKKYRRVRCENFQDLIKETNYSENIGRLLACSAPTFSFTWLDDDRVAYTLQCNNKHMTTTFTLGEEYEMERLDGSKIKITYTLEEANVLKQLIKLPDGKVACFRREFNDKETKMIISIKGSDVTAKVYYEVVE